MLTREQRRMRMRGLGGSDMNALSGLSHRWRPIDVWRSKVDFDAEECLSEETPEANETIDTQRGDFLEPACRAWYAHIQRAYVEETGTIFHPEHERILATPDGKARFADGSVRGLEIKCPRFQKVGDWCDGDWPRGERVPLYYLPQVTCEAAVLGVDSVDVAVLLGDELRVINVPFDQGFFEQLVYLANKFWRDHVVTKKPPPPDASESYHQFLRDRHPNVVSGMIQADETMLREARAYFAAGQEIAKLEKIRDASRNYIESRIGDAQGVEFEKGAKIVWTANASKDVVDYPAMCRDMNITPETLAKYTSTKTYKRSFRTSFNAWKKQ